MNKNITKEAMLVFILSAFIVIFAMFFNGYLYSAIIDYMIKNKIGVDCIDNICGTVSLIGQNIIGIISILIVMFVISLIMPFTISPVKNKNSQIFWQSITFAILSMITLVSMIDSVYMFYLMILIAYTSGRVFGDNK